MAFAIAHPGVTSALIGPRTMEHLEDLLAGVEVSLSDEVLNRIDTVVPPAPTSACSTWPTRRPRPGAPICAVVPPTSAPPPERPRDRRRTRTAPVATRRWWVMVVISTAEPSRTSGGPHQGIGHRCTWRGLLYRHSEGVLPSITTASAATTACPTRPAVTRAVGSST